MLIAVTGRIGSGKSSVRRELKNIGYATVDLDQVAKHIIDPKIEELRNVSSDNTASGIVAKIFSDDALYKKYCSLFEPHLLDYLERLDKNKVIIVEASALFAYPKLQKKFDHIIEIACSDKLRAKNLSTRKTSGEYIATIDSRYSKIAGSITLNIDSHNDLHHQLFQWMQRLDDRRIGWFCGSFNPFTIGHKNILHKAQKMFDEVIVVRAINPEKDAQLRSINLTATVIDNVKFIPEILERTIRRPTLIRGIRNEQDVLDAINWNEAICSIMQERINMCLIPCDPEFKHISSSLVRQIEKISQFDAYKLLGDNS